MQKQSKLKWSDEANDYFKKVPPFVRPMAKKGVEKFARTQGVSIITPELILAAKGENNGSHETDEMNKSTINLGTLNKTTSRMHKKNDSYFAREGVDPLRYAFEKKAAVHAGVSGEHLPSDQVASTWESLVKLPDHNKRRTVYVHIPFCQSHCRFCGFYMYNKDECISKEYTDALLTEMKQIEAAEAVAGNPIHAVYFGGGTPTDLEAVDLQRLLSGMQKILPLAGDCEITIEGRVTGFDSEKITACLDGGANRFSIGVQSFSTTVRRKMGRIADRATVLTMLDDLTSRNSATTVIDMIYGFPGQTIEIWQEDVRTFLEETELDGCDMYQLNIFRGGSLATAIAEGRLTPAADISLQSEMFAYGRREAMRARMKRLSMNHWGWDSRERNRYNSFTRYGATCIPFGCGAGGRLQGHHFFQEGDLNQYYNFVKKGEKPIASALLLPARRPFFRDLVGQMEEGSVNLSRLAKDHELDIAGIFKPLFDQWQQAGLMEIDEDNWLELTEAGEFWNVTMAQKMIDYFNQNQK